jgi:8-oxo-dGTP diphosphatase
MALLEEYVDACSLTGQPPRKQETLIAEIAPVRVVGVAVIDLDDGGRQRVLAARRTAPPAAAGGWELPGGKSEPGEDVAATAVREIAEELGCRVRVTGHLAGVQPIGPGLTLEVVTAVLVGGAPAPTEHDALRWLTADELDEVRWLAADVPFLAELADVLRRGAES